MKAFEEKMRYEYSLTANDIVMDVGAHHGGFAAMIHDKFGCAVHCYEPVPEFYNLCIKRFKGNYDITVHPYALGKRDSVSIMGVKGDQSGEFCTSPNETIEVEIQDVASVPPIGDETAGRVGLLKINAEGSEYDILERLIVTGLIKRIDHIQVQFHTVAPNYLFRLTAIHAQLALTHDLTFDEPFIWTGWSRKK